MQKLQTIQMFMQVLALIDLFGAALFVIIATAAVSTMHKKIDEMYKEFKEGNWRFKK